MVASSEPPSDLSSHERPMQIISPQEEVQRYENGTIIWAMILTRALPVLVLMCLCLAGGAALIYGLKLFEDSRETHTAVSLWEEGIATQAALSASETGTAEALEEVNTATFTPTLPRPTSTPPPHTPASKNGIHADNAEDFALPQAPPHDINATIAFHSYDASGRWATFRVTNMSDGVTLESTTTRIKNRDTGADYYGPLHSNSPFLSDSTSGILESSVAPGATKYVRYRLSGTPSGVPCQAAITLHATDGGSGESMTKILDFDVAVQVAIAMPTVMVRLRDKQDRDVQDYGMAIRRADVPAGTLYWKCIRVHHLTPGENRGKHNVYFNVFDENGRSVGQGEVSVMLKWQGGSDHIALDKSYPAEPMGNAPIWKNQVVEVQVASALGSDRVSGIHTNHPDEPLPDGSLGNSRFHHSVLVEWQLTRKQAGELGGFEIGRCASIPGENYRQTWIIPPPTDRPAETHPDLNLSIRGYAPTNARKDFVFYRGDTDEKAVQLSGLLGHGSRAVISSVYRVYDWDWTRHRRAGLLSDPEVTLMGLAVTPGDIIYLPDSGRTLGEGFEALLLYANSTSLTIKYTREDNVTNGYSLHLEHICPEPRLLTLYQNCNARGRLRLPALRSGHALGRASGSELVVAIRDNGDFMDPRSGKDWWSR